MNRRGFLGRLMALGAGIVVVGPHVLADVHRYIPVYTPKLLAGRDATITPVRIYRRIQIDNFADDLYGVSVARQMEEAQRYLSKQLTVRLEEWQEESWRQVIQDRGRRTRRGMLG